MNEPDLVKTAITGLDGILRGGIPRGNVILVEGPAGSGKTTLGLEFIYRGVTEFNEPGLIVLFEVSPLKVVRDAAQFGWDFPELERQGKVKIIFTTRSVLQQELQQADSLLLAEAAQIGARRMFIDSLPPLPHDGPTGHDGHNGGSREGFHVLVQGLHRENLTAMLGIEAPSLERIRLATPPVEEFIADTIVVLRIDDVHRAVTRSIEVVKSRGHQFEMGSHSFRIVDGNGLEVYRRVQAPRDVTRELAASFDPNTRISTGVPGLDEVVNGGYFLGSTTLVVGVSGVGKSVMGLQYIAEGARRGERGLMLSLDETPAQIQRNAKSSLVDNILLLNWVELGDEFRLGLTVAKMRANPTSRVTHECEVVNGQGMRVLPRQVPKSALPFGDYFGLVSRAPERHTKRA